ncbi:hypothetical protein BJ741DRAFT_647239 [Chytriomyces cf. hyalinus JEL632]|nr:hypothetical protein BJ741DRAFT_647239 [Chytriomyces cf. hyalinus JEL632]
MDFSIRVPNQSRKIRRQSTGTQRYQEYGLSSAYGGGGGRGGGGYGYGGGANGYGNGYGSPQGYSSPMLPSPGYAPHESGHGQYEQEYGQYEQGYTQNDRGLAQYDSGYGSAYRPQTPPQMAQRMRATSMSRSIAVPGNVKDPECVIMSGVLATAPVKHYKLAPSVSQALVQRHLLLAVPKDTKDLQQLYERVFLHALPVTHGPTDDYDSEEESERGHGFRNGIVPDILDSRVCMAFGHIAKAAVEKTPVLIVMGSSIRQESPQFINMNTIDHFITEGELGIPGTLAFRAGKQEHRYTASSSRDYQRWETAFLKAMQIVTQTRQMLAVANKHVSETPSSSAYSSAWSESLDLRNSSRLSSNASPLNSGAASTTTTIGVNSGAKKSINNLKNKVLSFKAFAISKKQDDQVFESNGASRSATRSVYSSSSQLYGDTPATAKHQSNQDIVYQTPPGAPPAMQVGLSTGARQETVGSASRTTVQSQTLPKPPPKDSDFDFTDNFTEDVLESFIYDHQSSAASMSPPIRLNALSPPPPPSSSSKPISRVSVEKVDVPQVAAVASSSDRLKNETPYAHKPAPLDKFRYSEYVSFVSERIPGP